MKHIVPISRKPALAGSPVDILFIIDILEAIAVKKAAQAT